MEIGTIIIFENVKLFSYYQLLNWYMRRIRQVSVSGKI